MTKPKNILVAPLNWGLGHATRCIPIINELLNNSYTPIIASDGEALVLLQKEFPELTCIELPSYHISYAKNARFFKWKMLTKLPKLIIAVFKEQQQIKELSTQFNLNGIISDNRFGVHQQDIPSVYISHQLTVLSGYSTWFTSWVHQKIISKFNECWVPDIKDNNSFSGKLSRSKKQLKNVIYIGALSRFKKNESIIAYDYLILLSGPEPQRSILESQLLKTFKHSTKRVLFIKGKVSSNQVTTSINNMTIYNFMTSNQLEKAIQQSRIVISRSGYTTIMDLATIGKKAFFIPTPGQYEQLYLAKRMQDLHYTPFALQENFCLEKLDTIDEYQGLKALGEPTNFNALFRIFN